MDRMKVVVDCSAPQGKAAQDVRIEPIKGDELAELETREALAVIAVAETAQKRSLGDAQRDADLASVRAAAAKDPTFAALVRLLALDEEGASVGLVGEATIG